MPIHSIKSVFSGIVGTVLGGVVLLWILGIGPFSKNTNTNTTDEPIEKEKTNLSAGFSFHTPELKFFEGGSTTVPRQERVYSNTFDAETSRYIYWELNIKHKEVEKDTPFNLLVIYRDSKGNEKTRKNYQVAVQKGWKNTSFTWGWGSEDPGTWPPDTYSVELFYQGNLIIKNTFDTV